MTNVIHYYSLKRYQRYYDNRPTEFRQLCTNTWEKSPSERPNWGCSLEKIQARGFTTAPAQVTCPACLKVLITKAESELALMKSRLKESGPSVAPLPEANVGASPTDSSQGI